MYAYFYDSQQICAVLEFAEYGNLYQMLKKQGDKAFDENTVRKII